MWLVYAAHVCDVRVAYFETRICEIFSNLLCNHKIFGANISFYCLLYRDTTFLLFQKETNMFDSSR